MSGSDSGQNQCAARAAQGPWVVVVTMSAMGIGVGIEVKRDE